MPSANQEKIWIKIGKQYSGKGKKGHLGSISPLPAEKKYRLYYRKQPSHLFSTRMLPSPRVFDLWCHRVVGGMKRQRKLSAVATSIGSIFVAI